MIDPRILNAAFLGLLVAAGIIYASGYQGSFLGVSIGPAKPLLMMAGR